jgi:hypothetical protein
MRTRLAVGIIGAACAAGLMAATPASAATPAMPLKSAYGQVAAGLVDEVGHRRWYRRHAYRYRPWRYRSYGFYRPYAYYRPYYYQPWGYWPYHRPWYGPGVNFWFGF